MQSTLVLQRMAARSLNLRTDIAQVLVSMLGKIFKTSLWPLKSLSVATDKSFLTSLKSGAAVFIFGSSPLVCIGFPPKIIVAIGCFFLLPKSKDLFAEIKHQRRYCRILTCNKKNKKTSHWLWPVRCLFEIG